MNTIVVMYHLKLSREHKGDYEGNGRNEEWEYGMCAKVSERPLRTFCFDTSLFSTMENICLSLYIFLLKPGGWGFYFVVLTM